MSQPTPEQWWDGLEENDRHLFMEAADKPPLPMPRDLADKMRAAGVLVAEVGWGNGALEPVFPRPYFEHARKRAREARRASNAE